MIRLLPLVLLPLLAACGVDGAPVPPSRVERDDGPPPQDSRPQGGILISGSAGVGIGGRL